MLSTFPVKRQPGVKLMKAFMLFTGSGPLVVLTSHDAITDPALLRKFVAKGIDKFIAHEIPIALARQRYGGHFEVVLRDLHETDDLRILDYNGERAFRLFRLAEIGPAILHEPAHS
jgi:hypothetical protein